MSPFTPLYIRYTLDLKNIMNIIGRIGNIVYIDMSHIREIVTAVLHDSNQLEHIEEYSSIYFIELAVYGESQYINTDPVTKNDIIAYNKRIVYT